MTLAELKTTATDKIDEGLHTAKRVARQRAQEFEDLRDATALKIRRSPFQAMAIGIGSGLLVGLAVGFAKGRARRRNVTKV